MSIQDINKTDRLLFDHIQEFYAGSDSSELYDKVRAVIWKRVTFPQEFEIATKIVSKRPNFTAKNFKYESALIVFDLVLNSGKLDELICSYI